MTGTDGQNETEGMLAAVVFTGGEDVDTLLAEVAAAFAGRRVAGVVQTGGNGCEVRTLALKGLRGGWEIPILEERGAQSRGCRLNPQAITEVAGRLEADLAAGADLLLVNRFGRAESEGYGLRPILEQAVMTGIPALVAVRQDYVEAWEDFHGGMGERLPQDRAAIFAWCDAALSRAQIVAETA